MTQRARSRVFTLSSCALPFFHSAEKRTVFFFHRGLCIGLEGRRIRVIVGCRNDQRIRNHEKELCVGLSSTEYVRFYPQKDRSKFKSRKNVHVIHEFETQPSKI